MPGRSRPPGTHFHANSRLGAMRSWPHSRRTNGNQSAIASAGMSGGVEGARGGCGDLEKGLNFISQILPTQ